jgi:hypothetical protein
MENTNIERHQGEELMKTLAQKAWENSAFKEQLIKDPVTTIQEFTGKHFEIPENQKFIVVDQTDESTVYFNIPKDPNNMQLTETQLEIVAGGAPGNLFYDAGLALRDWLHSWV